MRMQEEAKGKSKLNEDKSQEKVEKTWIHLMKFGEKTGCHQRADRSFFIKGYQMPVCARCSGVILGYLLAIPCFILLGFSGVLSFAGSLVLFCDWLLQALKVKESTNRRRLITGILGGYGLMSIQLFLLKRMKSWCLSR